MSGGVHRFASESSSCAAAQPNRLLATSTDIGWTSLLLDRMQGEGECDPFETHATSDLTLVVAVAGEHRIEVFTDGKWRRAVYQPGAAGLTPPHERTRLRWRSFRAAETFETVHLSLPHTLIGEVTEELRRVGQRWLEQPLSALVFNDPAVHHAVLALLRAMVVGAPDLYAEQVGRWLAVHLLSPQCSPVGPLEDLRNPGVISDRRLGRVVEYMSSRLEAPLTAGELAREAGISVHHFARCFRKQTGSTPVAFLTRLRMDTACRLLRTTDLSVAEIATMCGYTRPSAFAAAFMRRFQLSPSAARAGPNGTSHRENAKDHRRNAETPRQRNALDASA